VTKPHPEAPRRLSPETRAVHGPEAQHTGPSSTPIVHSSTWGFESLDAMNAEQQKGPASAFYQRYGHPTVRACERRFADLEETVSLVEALDRRIVARQADVRNYGALEAAFDAGIAELGRIDIVVANAGIIRLASEADPVTEWNDILGTNLTGVWNTCRIAIPLMIEAGRGGSIVMTSSTAGLKAPATMLAGGQAYSAAKHGLVGLMRTFASELAKHSIRVNTVHPTGVATGMVMNETMAAMMADPGAVTATMQNAMPIEILQPDLPRLALVALQFPHWTDGRAYSQARLLRTRLRFGGEVRATGEVLVDMLPLLQRTGFDAAQLRADQRLESAQHSLRFFAGHYQGDVTEPKPVFRRQGAASAAQHVGH